MTDIKYEVVRTNRKTLAIIVRDGKVIVRAPLKLPNKKITELVLKRQNWITKKIQEQTQERFSDVRNLKTVLVFGKEKRLVVGCGLSFETDTDVYIKEVSCLREVIENNYASAVFNEISYLAEMVGKKPTELQLCSLRVGWWGACDVHGIVKISWRVLFLPPKIQRYIFIHELCHLKQLNHSKLFWNEVGKYCPEYSKLRKELKDYSFLMRLYKN